MEYFSLLSDLSAATVLESEGPWSPNVNKGAAWKRNLCFSVVHPKNLTPCQEDNLRCGMHSVSEEYFAGSMQFVQADILDKSMLEENLSQRN